MLGCPVSQVGLHGFHCHVKLAAINISHKGAGLYFEYANDNAHLPKNPLGLIVNGLCFSTDNVFSIRYICSRLVVVGSAMGATLRSDYKYEIVCEFDFLISGRGLKIVICPTNRVSFSQHPSQAGV